MDDIVRWYSLTVAVLTAIIGMPQLKSFLGERGKRKLHWQSSIMWNYTVILGTIESLAGGYPGGLRVYFTALSVSWLFAAVAYKPFMRWRNSRQAHKETLP